MIKPLLCFLILSLTLSGCVVSKNSVELKSLPLVWEDQGFKWGAQLNNYPLNLLNEGFNKERVAKEMQLLKQLGVSYIRSNLEIADNLASDSPTTAILDQVNDEIVNLASQYWLNPVLVLEPGERFNEGDLDHVYNLAFDRAYRTAARYRNRVRYYQLSNEISGVTLWRADDSGDSLPDPYGYKYNKERYERAKAWLKGFSDGVSKADPSARKIITGHWAWHKIIDYLVNDGVNFDIIGWAWYSPDGTDPTNLKIANIGKEFNINLIDELAKFKKEIWIIESNRHRGSYGPDGDGEEKQADFMQNVLNNIYYNKYIKGYFVFPFLDSPPEVNTTREDDYWGIVRIKKDANGSYQFGESKKAFWAYRNFISSHY